MYAKVYIYKHTPICIYIYNCIFTYMYPLVVIPETNLEEPVSLRLCTGVATCW